MYKFPIAFCGVLLCLLFAASSQVKAAEPSFAWTIPNSSGLLCSNHVNCFNNNRIIKFTVNDEDGIALVRIEGKISDTWITVDEIAVANEVSYSLSKQYDLASKFKVPTGTVKDGELRIYTQDQNGAGIYSNTVQFKIDRNNPRINPLLESNPILFVNTHRELIQKFEISDAVTGALSAGLNQFRFKVVKDTYSPDDGWFPAATGVEGTVDNLPLAQSQTEQITVVFNWDRTLAEGYYWMSYELSDHSINSESASGAATQYNTAYANCKNANNGTQCSHVSGSKFSDLYFPFVIDSSPPSFTGITINGATPDPGVELSGPVDLEINYQDSFSWIKEANAYINGNKVSLTVPSRSKSGKINKAFAASDFQDGQNQIEFCLIDYANNVKCTSTNIDISNPAEEIVTVDWTASVSGMTVSFQGNVYPANTNIASYLWNFGDGKTATTKNASHTYAAAGTYDVSFTAIPANLPIGAQPPRSSGKITIVATTTGGGSTGGSGTVNNGAGNNNGGSTGGGGTTTGQTPGGTSTSNNDSNFYFRDPKPIYTYVGDAVNLEIVVSGGLQFKSYLWQMGNKDEDTTLDPRFTYNYDTAGSYQVIVTAIDQHGESHQALRTIFVSEYAQTEVQGEASPGTSFNRAVITARDILDFAIRNPLPCSLLLILFLAFALSFLRRRKLEEEEPLFQLNVDPHRPLIAKRIGTRPEDA